MSVLGERSGGKRRYLPASERRAQILSCARDVFARRGFHLASIADICEAAGIGRGTLYQYFANKRDVLTAVLEELSDRVRAVLQERQTIATLAGADEAPPKLIAAFCEIRLRQMLDAVFVDEASLRLLLREARGLDGGIDAIIERVDGVVLAALVSDITAAQELGVIECDDPRLVAQFVIGGVEKMVLKALASDEPVDLDRIVRVATRIQLHGLLSERTRRRGEREKER